MRYTLLLAALVSIALVGADSPAKSESGAATDTSFFNGKNLDGWEGVAEYWSVKDGAIVGHPPKDPGYNNFLCSKKKYGDFEMSFKVRLKDGKGNSGVQIRSHRIDKDPKKPFVVGGPQADIGQGFWGSLYGEQFGGMMKQSPAELVKKVVKQDDFNDYSIRCVGKHVTIKVNGETMVDDDFAKMPDEGIIAFQLHAGFGAMEVTFKDIHFKELSKKKTDKENIQGTWTAVSAEASGKAAPPEAIMNFSLVIGADKIVFNPKGENRAASYKLDPTKTPKVIELTPFDGPDKGKAQRALYELDGDRLKLCVQNGKGDPPTEFATKPGTDLRLLILKRSKK